MVANTCPRARDGEGRDGRGLPPVRFCPFGPLVRWLRPFSLFIDAFPYGREPLAFYRGATTRRPLRDSLITLAAIRTSNPQSTQSAIVTRTNVPISRAIRCGAPNASEFRFFWTSCDIASRAARAEIVSTRFDALNNRRATMNLSVLSISDFWYQRLHDREIVLYYCIMYNCQLTYDYRD